MKNEHRNRFDEILLNINIDGAGYKEGKSAWSFSGLPEEIREKAEAVLRKFDGITEGVRWPQGDHSIFIQNGCPAIAVFAQWFIENIESQEVTHTPKDNIEIVDHQKVYYIIFSMSIYFGLNSATARSFGPNGSLPRGETRVFPLESPLPNGRFRENCAFPGECNPYKGSNPSPRKLQKPRARGFCSSLLGLVYEVRTFLSIGFCQKLSAMLK